MALRACNNPKITGPALSRAITKLVDEHAKAKFIAFSKSERLTRKGDELISFAMVRRTRGEAGEGEGGERRGAPQS